MVLLDPSDPLASSFFPDTDDCKDNWLCPTDFDCSLPSLDSPFLPQLDVSSASGKRALETNVLDWSWQIDRAATTDFNVSSDSNPTNYYSTAILGCDDVGYLSASPQSEPLTLTTERTQSPVMKVPPKRKPGRPRLYRSDSESSVSGSSNSAKSRRSRIRKRQPHNEVERKYRESLNAELERLRMAVPMLPRCQSQEENSPPKPSKAVVLASAIDYIHKMEVERDRLLEENKMLKSSRRLMSSAY